MNEKMVWSLIGSGMIGASLGAAVTLGVLKKKITAMTDLSEINKEIEEVIELGKKLRNEEN